MTKFERLVFWYCHYRSRGVLKGTAYMNALFLVDEKLYYTIEATESDCMHDDDNIPTFLEKLQEAWENEPGGIL